MTNLNSYGCQEYSLRNSQQAAVDKFLNYVRHTPACRPEFLLNCVMRWGKCFTALSTITEYNKSLIGPEKPIKDVLIATFFPEVEDSWSRLIPPYGKEAQDRFKNFNFISLKSKNKPKNDADTINVFFVSFQELYTGKQKKNIFYGRTYDLLILDEYHYGAYNSKAGEALSQITEAKVELNNADTALKKIQYKYKLELSGTPYKLLKWGQYGEDNTYTISYFDEQRSKYEDKDSEFKDSPTLKLYSVNINDKCKLSYKDEIDFLFNNTKIFGDGKEESLRYKYNGASLWLIDSVSDAEYIGQLLKKYHNEVNVINLYDDKYKKNESALAIVNRELDNTEKYSIILSYNKLTLGVTVEKIESVVFMRDITTPELYMQAACRAKSQYSDKCKKFSYLVSFNIENDYDIFKEITHHNIDEQEFLKCFPITAVDYNSETNQAELFDITGDESFLNELERLPIGTVANRCVSKTLNVIDVIPEDILVALNDVSGIGDNRVGAKKMDAGIIEEAREKAESEEGRIGRSGFADGRMAYVFGNNIPTIVYPDSELKQKVYERGFARGYNSWDAPSAPKDSPADKTLNSAVERIKILIKRLFYVMFGDYFIENKFIDITNPENVPESFFNSMLHFDKKLFVKMYNCGLFNLEIIDSAIRSFKTKEDKDTPWLAFIKEDEYSSEEVPEDYQKPADVVEISEEDTVEPVEEVQKEKPEKKRLKYIYIAVPSKFSEEFINTLKCIKMTSMKGTDVYSNIEHAIDVFTKASTGTKIGETHRTPDDRLEELNGYTLDTGDNHILYDMYKFMEVPESCSDIEFHEYLEGKGYVRIKDDMRRELFDINPDKAYELLTEYVKTKEN